MIKPGDTFVNVDIPLIADVNLKAVMAIWYTFTPSIPKGSKRT